LSDDNRNENDKPQNAAPEGESFKDQIMRALREGNGTAAPNYNSSIKKEEPAREVISKADLMKEEDEVTPDGIELLKSTEVENSSDKEEEKETPEELPQEEPQIMTRSQAKPEKSKAKKKKKNSKDEDDEPVGVVKEDRIVGKIVTTVIVVLVLVVGIAGFSFWRFVDSSLQPKNPDATEYVTVNIPLGSSNRAIGGILQEDGIIRNGTVFNYYTKFHNIANFGSGYYNFRASMTLDEIIAMLQEGGTEQPQIPALGRILIPEGFNVLQIARAMETNADNREHPETPFSAQKFLDVVDSQEFFDDMRAQYPELFAGADVPDVIHRMEGYLFPATYDYNEHSTERSMAEAMVAAMDANMRANNFYELIAQNPRGFNVHQILTLAAYVEKEGKTEEDRRNIAQVFLNRLDLNMPLETNPSVHYAQGNLGTGNLTWDDDRMLDTRFDSPYNLYMHTGLGPGPVASPSIMSIRAVLDPIPNDYIFFLADPATGKVYFSRTYEEHHALVQKYINVDN